MGIGSRLTCGLFARPITLSLLAAGLAVGSVATSADAALYTGNSATGFNGAVGNGTLDIVSDGTNLTITFDQAASLNDVLVLYFDTVAGGFSNTSTFTDSSDGGRRAVSGFNGTDRTQANFASGFTADFALDIAAGYTALFDLESNASHTFVAGASATGTDPRVVTVPLSAIGSPTAFSFVGTYIAESAFRSNETFGASTTAGGTNPGNTGSITFTESLAFPAVVPEPASVGVVALALMGAAMRRSRKV
jgi:hypothetical protein